MKAGFIPAVNQASKCQAPAKLGEAGPGGGFAGEGRSPSPRSYL